MSPIQAPWDRTVLARDYRAVLDTLEGGKDVPDEFICNGNTFVPDDYSRLASGFADTTAAGIVHDFDFNIGGGWREFRAANARYRRNLIRLGLNRPMAWARWVGVSCGVLHFNWH